ncbi:MAG: CAP domain-containing protein [Planctomycetes bacterium]|nr:CAP domain-containing protein [Planctomycetota bacterium]
MRPRSFIPAVLALGALLAHGEDPLPAADETSAKVLEKVNAYRKLAGQPAVKMDEELSKGCRAHAEYLKTNEGQPSTQGLGAHKEDAKLPGYTIEGEKAGGSADISFEDPVPSIDGLMATLFHRVPLLDPGLEKIGFGAIHGDKGWYVVVDVMSGRKGGGKATGKGPQPVLYPRDKQKDVPHEFSGELPNPIPDDKDGRAGYPITAQFPGGIPVKEASVGLKDADGKLLDCWVSSPEKPADARYQRNTICAMPKDVLKPGATYTVMMAAKVGGRPWSAEWKFTTEGVAEVKPPDKK